VNGDGKPDVLTANECASGCAPGDGVVGVLLGNGDGTFQPAVPYDSGGITSWSVAVADVNGDRKPDLVVANLGSNTVTVLLGSGDGTFQAVVSYGLGTTWPYSVVVADVNGDGKPDLVLASLRYCGPDDGCVSVLLNGDATTTTLVSSLNPSVYGQAVIFTATVSSASGTPRGTVTFYDGSTQIGSTTLVNGSASISISLLAAGSNSITAAYQGSGAFVPSTSAPLNQVVNRATTTTSLASSLNPALVNEIVTYTAIVASQYGGVATGTVVFQDGGATVATVTVVANHATYTTKYGTPGTHSMTATYSGDTNNTGSVSTTLVEQINKGFPSKTVLTTSGSPSFVGQPVTFTATITSARGAIPDGELVTFYDSTALIGTGTTASGLATFQTSSLTAKTHTIKAAYAGDDKFEPSSSKVTQVVEKYPTSTTLTSSLNPSRFGQAVTFTASVTSAGPAPTGKVKFMDGATALGSRTLTGGLARLTTSKLSVGTHQITAQYLSDAYNDKSTSPVVDQVVQ
jgi:Bacterial Ig-like domain (group 3)/FG-GAP-like repeat